MLVRFTVGPSFCVWQAFVFALHCSLDVTSESSLSECSWRRFYWHKLSPISSQGEKLPALWKRNQEVIVNRIRNQWKLDQWSSEEIHTMCGILEVNCFEVGGRNGTSARALFPEAYLMCHDCVPNTNHTDDPITHQLTVRTTKALKRGEVISLSYAYTLQVLIIFSPLTASQIAFNTTLNSDSSLRREHWKDDNTWTRRSFSGASASAARVLMNCRHKPARCSAPNASTASFCRRIRLMKAPTGGDYFILCRFMLHLKATRSLMDSECKWTL